ncbi:GMC oxidoreductase [Athelia psychrophila]|uniref:GMC oxidoreductase n=1 Tax=Athelia psychrophila TaxID=1759441 RepID=A0A166PD49_9AGAM|nr:GMC oxidoreductase [Fibularhizoctonia sp. CBS 109695]
MLPNVTSDASAFVEKAYDYVIIGGGTAGLALASRLSDNPNITIGVLEAGQDRSDDPTIRLAGGWLVSAFVPGAEFHWPFETTEQTHAAGQKVDVHRGKVLGGTSAINALMWTRASKAEYDALVELGNPGWSFDELLPYFKRSQAHTPQENNIIPGTGTLSPSQGSYGPVKTSFNTWYSSLIKPFLAAAATLSIPLNSDPNSGNMVGMNNVTRMVDNEDGTRSHSGAAYLPRTAGRNNISVLVGAYTTKIAIAKEGHELVAKQVHFDVDGTNHVVRANEEVILSAGAYQTPQILELSGIGKTSVLSKFGIETLLELPVGDNLQEQLLISTNASLTDEAVSNLSVDPFIEGLQPEPGKDAAATNTSGPFISVPIRSATSSSEHAEFVALLNSYLADESLTPLERAQFTIQRRWLSSADSSNVAELLCEFSCMPGLAGLPLADGRVTLWNPVAHLHPTSRGSVHINSPDPFAQPSIDPKFLSRAYDMKAFLQALRLREKIIRAPPLDSMITQSAIPPSSVQTDEEVEAFIKANITTFAHPVGTAAMAARNLGGVVDQNLKVYGTRNIRVVDASIIPLQISATPASTVFAIAEKAADIILATTS